MTGVQTCALPIFASRQIDAGVEEPEVRKAIADFEPLWDELFPAEQARIVQLLIERVDVSIDGAAIRLRTSGIASLIADVRAVRSSAA